MSDIVPIVERKAVPALKPAERAYQGIRDAILTGRLRQGELLAEEPLAAMTGTSRTPVREALRRLAVEGLAATVDRHHFVAELTFDEVALMFELRAEMEGFAAAIAAERIAPAEIDRLHRIVAAIDTLPPVAPRAEPGDFLRLNAEFHATVLDAGRSTQLRRLVAPVTALPLALMKRVMLDQPLDIARSNAEHRAIVAALAARDPAAARAAMAGHILATKPRRPVTPAADRPRRSPSGDAA